MSLSGRSEIWVSKSLQRRPILSNIPLHLNLPLYYCTTTARRRRPWASSWRTRGRGCPRCRWWTPCRPWRSCRRSRGSSRCASAGPRTRWSACPRCLMERGASGQFWASGRLVSNGAQCRSNTSSYDGVETGYKVAGYTVCGVPSFASIFDMFHRPLGWYCMLLCSPIGDQKFWDKKNIATEGTPHSVR